MRARADASRLGLFMEALGREAGRETRVYLTGGATAVLLGWRVRRRRGCDCHAACGGLS